MSSFNVIVGLGATGLSCARFLLSRGDKIAVTDSRANPPNLDALKEINPDVLLSMGQLDNDLLSKATTIVVSPGVALSEPSISEQLKRGTPVIGDIELFARAVDVPVIAITGTNAKSTVTTLVGLMSQASGHETAVGGNLGKPVLSLLEEKTKPELYVLELSSFQLETTFSLKPKVATILNITPDHMDRYESFEDYRQAKLKVYDSCEIAVCNRDDPLTEVEAKNKLYFTLGEPAKNEFGLLHEGGKTYLAHGKAKLIATDEIPVSGKHYYANVLAALAIGYAYGFPMEAMISVVRGFTGLPHRCELARERNGVKWYNDSKGTNVGASQAAIEGIGSSLKGKLVLILGGVGKQADFSPLLPLIEKYARHVVLIGEAAKELDALINKRVPVTKASTLEEAVNEADKVAKPNDAVLLSPACASFDMFKNFEDRGDAFKGLVSRL